MLLEYFATPNLEPTYAILPFLLIGLGALVFGGAVGAVIAIADSDGTDSTNVIGKSMAILGMQEAGKTQLLHTLQNKSYTTYQATATDDYNSFRITINGRVVEFTAGRDIGGDERYIRPYYEKFINEKDAIFFIFDVRRYLDEDVYAKDVKNRLSFIYRKLKDKFPFGVNNRYLIIGSHMDVLQPDRQKTAIKELQDSVHGKDYGELFHNNLLLCDLTDRDNLLKNFVERKII